MPKTKQLTVLLLQIHVLPLLLPCTAYLEYSENEALYVYNNKESICKWDILMLQKTLPQL